MNAEGAEAIEDCRQILHASGSSFSLAFRTLPREQRDAMTAFYAFCREVDDAVDDAPDSAAAERAVAVWRDRVRAIAAGAHEDDAVSRALAWAVSRFPIDPAHLALIVEGAEWDLSRAHYATFADLHDYIYRVATAVGLVVLSVTAPDDPPRPRYADLTGSAVQLTNILRDVGVDARLGRIYLPREDLDAFGVSEEDILALRKTDALTALLRFEAARARHLHELARASLSSAERRRLYFSETLRDTYRLLLDRLVEADHPIVGGLELGEALRVPRAAKLGVALRHRAWSLALKRMDRWLESR